METGVVAAEMLRFQMADRLDNGWLDQMCCVRDPGIHLQRVEEHRRGRAQEIGCLTGDDGSVLQFDRGAGTVRGGSFGKRGGNRFAIVHGQPRTVHEKLRLVDGVHADRALCLLHKTIVISADDFHFCGFRYRVVVVNAVACHVDAHIGRGLVGTLAVNALEKLAQHREDLDVAVVVYGRLAVRFQMERVDHVHVAEVDRGRFVGDVDRVGDRKVPDRERLKFRVAGFQPAQIVVVQLGQTGRHFAAAGAGCRDDDEGAFRLDVLVFAVPIGGEDRAQIRRVTGDRVVLEHADTQLAEPLDERVRGGLSGVMRDDDAADVQSPFPERVHEPERVHVVGDAEIGAHFVLFDRGGGYHDHDFRLLLEPHKHVDLAVGTEPGQHPGRVVVVKELAAEFQIQLAAEMGDPVEYLFRLQTVVFVVVKPEPHKIPASLILSKSYPYSKKTNPQYYTASDGKRQYFHRKTRDKNAPRFLVKSYENL